MNNNLRTFLFSFFIAAIVLVGVNAAHATLTEVFFWKTLASYEWSAEGTASLLEESKPLRRATVPAFQPNAEAVAISYLPSGGEKSKELFSHNAHEQRPIASLSKLMTAVVAVEQYSLEQPATIDRLLKEDNGQLKRGDVFTVEDLLHLLLIPSYNTPAYTLSTIMERDAFIGRMNTTAQQLHMDETAFADASGLDPDRPNGALNKSSADDVNTLLREVRAHPTIVDIMNTTKTKLYSRDNLTPYTIENTNELLGHDPRVIIGKTGWTPKARGCLAVIARAPGGDGRFLAVVLGAENRFSEMTRLLDWAEKAYIY